MTIAAKYENGVLKPLEDVKLGPTATISLMG
jgi:predicted DNA-binding antitoxin AbrB/MazE fold protein